MFKLSPGLVLRNCGFQSIPEWMPEGQAIDVAAAEIGEAELGLN